VVFVATRGEGWEDSTIPPPFFVPIDSNRDDGRGFRLVRLGLWM
jgi:hypothetical protein